MSRVGNREIKILDNVTVEISEDNFVIVKGPMGELKQQFSPKLMIEKVGNTILVKRSNETKQVKMLHGTTNALIQNMILGVDKGFKKELKIIGVGYNVKMQGDILEFSLGLSHKIRLQIPQHLKVVLNSLTEITITGADKQQVGELAAKIKSYRKPEPYGGKGIRYKDEHISLKAGKSGAKK